MLRRLIRATSTQCFSVAATSIGNLPKMEKDYISIEGWANSIHKLANLVFIKVSDGRFTNDVQIIAPKELFRVGSSLAVTGKWQKSTGSKQEMELFAEKLEVYSADANPRYDISENDLRKKIHLRARSVGFASVLTGRSIIFQETHHFFASREFIHIETPKLTKNDCEGGGNAYAVDEAGSSIYLTVSAQLHLEAMASRLSKVYTLGPAFRAEKQQSHTHLSEFNMLEAEVAFVQDINELCDIVEDYVKAMIRITLENQKLKEIISSMGIYHNKCLDSKKFHKIKFSEAVEILKGHGQEVKAKSGLSRQNEIKLVEIFNSPVFVTHFPSVQKPFYMQTIGENTASFDLLCPIVGELAGGSIREICPEKLKSRGCTIEWYLETRHRGQPPTGGFGIDFNMVKVKNRYYLVQMITNDGKEPDVSKYHFFSEITKHAQEMFGDFGYSIVKLSLSIRVSDEDVYVVRVAETGEKYLGAVLPNILKIGNQPMILKTLFVGRSMRSCEKRLIEIRRNDLYAALSNCKTPAIRHTLLKVLHNCCGKPSKIFSDEDMSRK
ncbi:unnamed protein product [Caenorhabditis bovis]|uniref:Aminoacyl-transfer RNA synthetases class-II family profile domain-containing protein n=1 Tax=Caenorhabditis bovis TaxID=2654633 RepID=A0A8S1EJG9_9PELO|nr:unnamed protein product [Caenorhabditis bovis]